MPVQTTSKNILFPDGCKVQVWESGAVAYTDIGAIGSAVTASLTFDENQLETANAGITSKQINNMRIEGGFTLINFDVDVINKLSGGMFTNVTTAASPNAAIPNQDVAAGWSDNTLYPLVMQTSSSDTTEIYMSTQPALTSVILDTASANETLVEDTEYYVVADTESSSGWSIGFMSANMATGSPTTLIITINYASNTPRASTAIHAGSSTATLTAMKLKFTHTDSNSLIRQLEIFSADVNSGFMQFNFKGANEDGSEEIPFTYVAKIDTSLTDGRQLMTWTYNDSAL